MLKCSAEISEKFNSLEWVQQVLQDKHRKEMDKDPYGEMAPHVALRNRYNNVEVYHNNRIVLQMPSDSCDYINASPIVLDRFEGDGHPSRYIATQVSCACIGGFCAVLMCCRDQKTSPLDTSGI